MVVPANGTPPAALEADLAHMIERGPGCVPSPVSSLIGRQCEIEAVCSPTQ